MTIKVISNISNASEQELDARHSFYDIFKNSPIPKSDLLQNLPLYVKRQDLSHILFLNEMYEQILNIRGSILDLGCRWGKQMALFANFRGIYEPFNHTRMIVGFDSFEGVKVSTNHDGDSPLVKKGQMAVTEDYDTHLSDVLKYHERESPISHMNKYRLYKGDACETIKEHFKHFPSQFVAFAYFDFGVYQPTIEVLNEIKDRIVKGAVIAFDQLGMEHAPGETTAFREVFSLNDRSITQSKYTPSSSYFIY